MNNKIPIIHDTIAEQITTIVIIAHIGTGLSSNSGGKYGDCCSGGLLGIDIVGGLYGCGGGGDGEGGGGDGEGGGGDGEGGGGDGGGGGDESGGGKSGSGKCGGESGGECGPIGKLGAGGVSGGNEGDMRLVVALLPIKVNGPLFPKNIVVKCCNHDTSPESKSFNIFVIIISSLEFNLINIL